MTIARVVVRLHAQGPLGIEDWLGFDAAGRQVAHGVSAALPAAEQYEVAIAASWLTVHGLQLPIVAAKQQQKLIHQALEDRVLGELEPLTWQAQSSVSGLTWVYLLERSRLLLLEDWLASQSWPCTRWVPEFALLPAGSDLYAQSGQGVMFCRNAQYGWLDDEADLLALYPDSTWHSIALADLTAPAADCVSFYKANKVKVSMAMHWQQWRSAVYLLVACLCLFLLSVVSEWRVLSGQERALRQEIRQTFASLFPGVPIVDPILQWQSRQKAGVPVGGAGQNGDALDLLHQMAGQIDVDAGIESVSVKAGRLQMVMLEAKSAALIAKLTAQGAKMKHQSMGDGRVRIEVER
ncbi:type II secretion system protein GspL [uncultured Deefgea sp.]|uniref:type II secretion system protein GspL n=1 Tax=uncultured Deefgea sp. TaxID=1304914 RepID=UPI002599883F|nr:type II secretion system protein GspL [uncultured Deefgea sp.]